MDLRMRTLAPLLLVCAALVLGPSSAFALGPVLAAPDLVYGVVVSLEPRVVPETGVIVTDVRVTESLPGGGTTLTRFAMKGGEVGRIGMWSERFTDLSVGDSVVARVADEDGEVSAVAAPMVTGGVTASGGPDVGLLVDGVAAGYAQNGIRWSDAALPVEYSVNQLGLPTGSDTAITAAAQTWEDDAGSHMDFAYEGATSTKPGEMDGECVVGSGPVSGAETIAECSIWYNSATHRINEFDIAYNTASFTFATNGNRSAFDVQSIGTHELGHTLHLLDLYDADNKDQVMYGWSNRGDTSQRVLKWGDIAGIRSIYPSAVNAAPVAVKNSYVTSAGTRLTVAAPGVLGNDTDADGDALSAVLVGRVSHGTLSLASSGSFTYTPDAGFSGSDAFTYQAYDGVAYSNTVTVTIAVAAADHAPVAANDVATVAENGSIHVEVPGVLGNDTDAGGSPLTASLTSDASHGALLLKTDGAFEYDPDTGWTGTDAFTYRAFNGVAYSEPARVAITVAPDTAPPLTTSNSVARYADAATITMIAVDASGVSSTDWVLTGAENRSGTGTTVGATTLGSYTLAFRSADTAGNVEPTRTVKFAVIATPASDGTASTPWKIPTLRHGKALTVSGYVIRHTTGSYPISLRFYRYKSGAWVYYKHTYAKASTILTFSKYSDSTSVPYAGKWRVRARSRYKVGSRYLYGGFRYFSAS